MGKNIGKKKIKKVKIFLGVIAFLLLTITGILGIITIQKNGLPFNLSKKAAEGNIKGIENISCNTNEIALNIAPSPVKTGSLIQFNITGDASTWIADDYGGGAVNCSGNWNKKNCTSSSSPGTFTWTHKWKHCVGDFQNCSPECLISKTYIVGINSGSSTPIQTDNFDTISFTPGGTVTQSLYTPPLQGKYSLKVTYGIGNTWANLVKKFDARDLRGNYLHLDVFPMGATKNWPSSMLVKMSAGGKKVMEDRKAVRVGEWNGLNFDLTGKDQELLSKVDTINLYMADSLNPGKLDFLIDDFYVSQVPLPEKDDRLTLIVIFRLNSIEIPDEVENYKKLNTNKTKFAFRTTAQGKDDDIVKNWDINNIPYYFAAASSDYKPKGKPLYTPIADVFEVLARPAVEGVYFHEVLSSLTHAAQYDWNKAINDLDWNYIIRVVNEAKAKGKKVIWSEPAESWRYISQSPNAAIYFPSWQGTLVPTFATNYQAKGSGYHLATARDYATLTAGKYQMRLGESHQSWYFRDEDIPITRLGSFALARLGYDQNASYYQFEGTQEDLTWDSNYMKGIRDFVNWVNKL